MTRSDERMSQSVLRTTASPDSEAIKDLVDANRILFDQGIVDAFGHVSMRDHERPDCFWLARNMAPGQVTEDDLIRFNLDGTAEHDKRRPYLERFIHSEVYRARPDVMAVVHSHSPAVIPFSIVDVPLKPVCHMCGFIKGRVPVFEIRECAGEASDMLIRDARLGAAFASRLGGDNLALMRGHGVTVVGSTLRQAVFRAVYTEFNARVQGDALRLSSRVTYLTDEEADAAAFANDTQIDRAWAFWRQRAQGASS